MTVFELVAKLTLDSKEYDKKLTEASKQMSSLATSFEKNGNNIKSFGKSVYSIGDTLTKYITKPAMVATTALGGIFLAKGWSRVTQLDTAKAKLKALGNSASSVAKVMDSASQAVIGTAFALDEAATTAASAVAAGISEGSDLTKYLTTVADTAAIAGTSMADMGSIFNKVATTGKATGEVLAQLADRGIPIFQWLSEEIGVTTEEVAEMASKGEISLETFRSAVDKHVKGAAQAMGDATLTGALANLWAAVGRVGAAFIGSSDDANTFAGQLRPVIIDIKNWISGLQDKAAEWGKVFGEVFKAFVEWCKTGSASLDGMSDSAKAIWTTLEPTLNMIRSILSTMADVWNGMSEGERAATVKALALTVALGPLVKGLGSLIITVGSVTSGVGKVIEVFGKFAGAGTTATTVATKTATAMETVSTSSTAASFSLSRVVSSIGSFAAESGVAAATLEAGVITGIVALGAEGQKLVEKLRGGNGALSEFGGALHSIQDELVSTGKITKDQANELFKAVEKWESAGDSGTVMAQKFTMSLREMGVSSDDASTAINSLSSSNVVTASTTDILKSKVALLKDETAEAADKTTRTVTSFDALKEAVNQTSIEMGLSEYQIGTLMESMSKGDGSAQALAQAYDSLMKTTSVVGVETSVFAEKLAVDVPGATEKANAAINSTQKTSNNFLVTLKTIGTGIRGLWDKGKTLLSNIQNDIAASFSSSARTVNQKTSDMSNSAKTNLRSAQSTIASIMSSIKSSITSNYSSASSSVQSTLSGMKSNSSSVFSSIKSDIASKVSSIQSDVSSKFSTISSNVSSSMNSIKKKITDDFDTASGNVKNAMSNMNSNVSSGSSTVNSTVTSMCNSIATSYSNLAKNGSTWGQDLVKNLSNGIGNTSVGKTLQDTLDKIAQKIKDTLGFSEPKVGPLSNFHTYAPDMMQLFAKGVRENEHVVTDQIEKSFDFSDMMAGPSFGVNGMDSVKGGGVTQILNITSPQPLDALEVARQSKKSMIDMTLAMNLG